MLFRSTLALSSFTLSAGLFSSNNSNTRTLNFGTGKIILNSATTSTVWTTATLTGLTISGTPLVECQGGGSAITKTISVGAPADANTFLSFSLLETTGTVSYTFTANNTFKNLVFNGSQTVTNNPIVVYGNVSYLSTNGTTTFTAGTNAWTFGSTSNIQNFAGNAATFDFPIIVNGSGTTVTLTGNVTMGVSRALTLTNGNINLNGKTWSTN